MRPVVGWLVPAIAALALVGVVFATTPTIELNGGFDNDGQRYGAMAGSSRFSAATAQRAPYAYRVLTPYLVSALPWDTLQGFRVVAFLSNAVSLVLLWQILRRLAFPVWLQGLGVALYALDFWTLRFAAYSPAYIDHQTQMFALAIILLTVTRRYRALVPVLVLAALQKESLAFFAAVPAFALLHERGYRVDARSAGLALALVAAPLAAAALVRVLVPIVNPYRAADVVWQELSRWATPTFPVVLLSAALTGLGVLPLLLPLRHAEWLGFLRTHPEWIVYLAISAALLFGGRDKSRLFAYGLPLVLVLALQAIASLRAAAEPRRFALWLGAALALHAFLGGWLTPLGSYDDYVARLVPEVGRRQSIPFVIQNFALALGFLALSPWLLFGRWRFDRAVGFAR